MFLKKLDLISPKITIYNKGSLIHSSIFSGIISIISIIFIFIILIYYSLDIIQKKNPIIYNIESYIEDVQIFKVNLTSFFHFINIISVGSGNLTDGVDFTKVRIIGSMIYYSTYLHSSLKRVDYWVYGKCDNNSDFGEIGKLITYDFFQKCACIKKYHDHITDKFYDIKDPNFKWPEIGHGLSHDDNMMYSIFVQNCSEQFIGEVLENASCTKNPTEIKQYFQTPKIQRIFHIYFLDHYVNSSDYNNPKKLFFSRLETPLDLEQYTVHHMKFKPFIIKTDSGYILERTKEELSYSYDRNEEYINEKGSTDLFISYSFMFKNVMLEYERKYKRIQDIISEVGGFYKFAQIIAFYLNYLYNNYIVLTDTQILLSNLIKEEQGNINFKENIFQKLKDLKEIRDRNEKPKEKEKTDNSTTARINNNKRNKYIINQGVENFLNNNNTNINQSNYSIDRNKIKSLVLSKENTLKRYHSTFFKFLLYRLSCDGKNNYYKVYHSFRIKIISEEHFIRSHLIIYNLLKAKKEKRNRYKKRYSYQIDDLMNII
jgi:hypothetical protein